MHLGEFSTIVIVPMMDANNKHSKMRPVIRDVGCFWAVDNIDGEIMVSLKNGKNIMLSLVYLRKSAPSAVCPKKTLFSWRGQLEISLSD